ncbi:DUF1844 domain-containing protein [Frigoribacterium sp. MCBA15_019]|uniref:DUF1844 domain-containing protein n=1 Tax=Frigoribacterium sp. MCBA15_019 TaxID=1898745 RepID=UPI000A872287
MSHSPDDAPIPDARFGDSAPAPSPDTSPATARFEDDLRFGDDAARDIADVNAVEVINTVCVHLMSAAAVKVGLADDPQRQTDLDEARKLITSLAGLVTASAPEIGDQHARALRDGLRSLQLAFREASAIPDAIGQGPGEKYTGPVN